MTVLGDMVGESSLCMLNLQVFPVWILDYEDSVIFDNICNSDLALGVIQCQNFGGGLFIKTYLTIYFSISFAGALNGSIIYFDCH